MIDYFQSRVNQGKMNEDFYKAIIEENIKDKLKLVKGHIICLTSRTIPL